MIKNLFLRYALIVTAISAMALMSPINQTGVALEGQATSAVGTEDGRRGDAPPLANLQGDTSKGHPTSVIDIKPGQRDAAAESDVSIMAFPTPSNRKYYLTSSCKNHATVIKKGAAAWSGLTEGGGTPVSCTNGFIQDCGGDRVVGCNYGRGQRITLYVGGVKDGALLAAHEFGHNWFDHSTYSCAGWSNAEHIMAPAICN